MREKNLDFQRLSEVLSFIRIPFFVLIIFIHNTNTAILENSSLFQIRDAYPVFFCTSEIISEVIARVAVPGFFLISGFFFFFNKEFNKGFYLKQLKKKTKTLLIPFAFWNTLAVFLLVLVPILIPSLAQNKHSFSLGELISSLWCTRNGHALNQLWYIRDLMCCMIISPLLYYPLKRIKLSVLLLFALWFFDIQVPVIGPYGFSNTALFWFSLGAVVGIHKMDFVEFLLKVPGLILFSIFLASLDIFTLENSFNPYIHKLFVVFGLAAFIKLVALLRDKIDFKRYNKLSSASFFVYAVHLPWIIIPLRMVMMRVLNPCTDGSLLLIYFVVVILTTVFSVLLYFLCLRYIPRITMFVTGGR